MKRRLMIAALLGFSVVAKADIDFAHFEIPAPVKDQTRIEVLLRCPDLYKTETLQVEELSVSENNEGLFYYHLSIQGRGYGVGDPDYKMVVTIAYIVDMENDVDVEDTYLHRFLVVVDTHGYCAK